MNAEKLLFDYVDSWNSGDIEKMLSHLTDDCVYFDAFFGDAVPYDEIRIYHQSDFELTNIRHTVTNVISCDSASVAASYKTEIIDRQGRGTSSFKGAEVLALRRGKISRITDYYVAPPELLALYDGKTVGDHGQDLSALESYYSKVLQCRSDFLRAIKRDCRYASQWPSLPTIAKKIGFDEEFLASVITQEFRCGFDEYVEKCKLRRARDIINVQVLLDPASTGQEEDGRIAREVGFDSKSSFIDAFRRTYKLGPLQYRRSIQENLGA